MVRLFLGVVAILLPTPAAADPLAWHWDEFGIVDAKTAHELMRGAVQSPEASVAFLADQFKAVPKPDSDEIAQLLADLDHPRFVVREQATLRLRDIGEVARPALEELFAKSSSAEARHRAERLLADFREQSLSAEELRLWRSLELLERIATPEAREVLDRLAEGAPEAWLTKHAQAARDRLDPTIPSPWEWDQVQPWEENPVLQGFPGVAYAVAVSPDGETIAAAGGRQLQLWDRVGEDQMAVWSVPGVVYALAFSPDGQTVATVGSGNLVLLWDIRTGVHRRFNGHTSTPRAVAFSPDGKTLATAGTDRVIRLWEMATGQERATLVGHTTTLRSLAFTPDGRWLVSSGSDKSVRLWDLNTDQTREPLLGHSGSVRAVAFSPDGTTLASGGYDDTVRLWDWATGQELRVLTGHPGNVLGLAFSPDGGTLISVGSGQAIRIWDVATGTERTALTAHQTSVNGVAFIPDGTAFVTAGSDRSVRLWELRPVAGNER